MVRHITLAIIQLLLVTNVQAELFGIPGTKNTPFDPDTWKKTVRNTPLDPKTWGKTIRDIKNGDSVLLCEKQASYFADTVKAYRPLTHAEKFYLRPWFGDLVDRVTLTTGVNINTFLGAFEGPAKFAAEAKTFGHRIYFAENIDRSKTLTLSTIAHELMSTLR